MPARNPNVTSPPATSFSDAILSLFEPKAPQMQSPQIMNAVNALEAENPSPLPPKTGGLGAALAAKSANAPAIVKNTPVPIGVSKPAAPAIDPNTPISLGKTLQTSEPSTSTTTVRKEGLAVGDDYKNAIKRGFETKKEALEGRKDGIENYGRQRNALNDQLATLTAQSETERAEQAERQKAYRNEMRDRVFAAEEKVKNSVLEGTDEHRDYWADKSTWDKVGAGLAIALGAMGGALTGTNKNVGLELVQRAIEADDRKAEADYQKKVLSSKLELASANNEMGFVTEEQAAAREELLTSQIVKREAVITQMQVALEQESDQQKKATIQSMIGDLEQQQGQKGLEIIQLEAPTTQTSTTERTGGTTEVEELITSAGIKAKGKKAKLGETTKNQMASLKQAIAEVKNYSSEWDKKHGITGGIIPATDSKKLEGLLTGTAPTVYKAYSGEAFNEGDRPTAESWFPDSLASKESKEFKINQTLQKLYGKLNLLEKEHGQPITRSSNNAAFGGE